MQIISVQHNQLARLDEHQVGDALRSNHHPYLLFNVSRRETHPNTVLLRLNRNVVSKPAHGIAHLAQSLNRGGPVALRGRRHRFVDERFDRPIAVAVQHLHNGVNSLSDMLRRPILSPKHLLHCENHR
jgi:hypothetical protein